MSEMIEKVAKAIFATVGQNMPPGAGWQSCIPQARAAIEAMGESSDEFLFTVKFHDGRHSRSGETWPVLRNFQRAFVDAALALTTPPSSLTGE